ncbi:MAG: hypothetical protein HKL85_03680 [Acidimicrobiaceae bacterium]|nr:hypothetical protein [Acidimicrobiaceae bacterium]
MSKSNQVQRGGGDIAGARNLRPRRSVVVGSLGLLVAGLVLSATALPAMANVIVGSSQFAQSRTAVTTARSDTVKSAPVARVMATSDKSAAVTTTRSATVKSAPVIEVTTTTVQRAVATTTVPVTTTTVKAAPVAKVPVTTTTVKAAPVAKVPVTTTTVKAAPVAKVTVTFSNAVPAVNVAPNPNFVTSGTSTLVNGVWTNTNPCVVGSATGISWPTFTNDAGCNNYVLMAINNARAQEGVKALVLPSNWYTLTTAQQLFVVADLERVDRGLPPYLGINAALSANAMHAALTNSDPTVAAGFAVANDAQGYKAMGSAWSSGYSVLAADYFWMYADGWGGSVATTSNIACTSAGAAGCWAHRLELLGSDPGFNPGVGLGTTNAEMGVGFAIVQGAASYADLIEVPAGAQPTMSFTWAANVLPYLN